jgi:ABC-type glycerol-3-phosphate transport system permease component
VLPLSSPRLLATATLCLLYFWNDFFIALILIRTEAMTAPVAVVGGHMMPNKTDRPRWYALGGCSAPVCMVAPAAVLLSAFTKRIGDAVWTRS